MPLTDVVIKAAKLGKTVVQKASSLLKVRFSKHC